MSKGTILYIGGFELPDKNAAAHRVLGNAKCLRKLGYDVVFAGIKKNKIDVRQDYSVSGFRCFDYAYPSTFKEWLVYLISISFFKNIIKRVNPDMIIAYNLPSIQLYRLMKLNKIDVYSDCTEWYESSGFFIHRAIKNIDVVLRMKYLNTKAIGIIVISDYLEKYYKGKGVKNIINIPPLVDSLDKKWIKKNGDKDNGNIIFAYAGSPGAGKKDRLDLVVMGLKRLSLYQSISLKIVGIHKTYYEKHFNGDKPLTKEYSFVDFLGRVSHNESIEIIKSADYIIFFRNDNLPNRAGFPTKFVESITAGTPVITNNMSNIKRFIKEEDHNIVIEIIDEKSIEDALDKAVLNYNSKKCEYNESRVKPKTFDYRNYIASFNDLFK